VKKERSWARNHVCLSQMIAPERFAATSAQF
jgi:hypothetical protein